MKPDVLVVTRNLPPLVGGMERLVWHIVDELRLSYHVLVVGPSGCQGQLPPDVTVVEIPLKPVWLFLLRSKFSALLMALRYRPVIILAGSGLTAPIVWLAARMVGARCIAYLHGLDIIVSHPLYRLFWLPVFARFDCVLVNSRFTRQLAVDAKISTDRITILHPGVDLSDMADAEKRRQDFRLRHHLGERPLMLSVGRITSRKGLFTFVQEIMPFILKKVPNVMLMVIGSDPTDALLSVMDERVRVQSVIDDRAWSEKVLWLGGCSQKELDDAYFAADVLVFPVQQQENDIEGFGMVAVEAAAHGLPTVAFAVGGVPDAVSDGCCGKLIFPENNLDFAHAVTALLKNKIIPEQRNECLNFALSFQWEVFGNRLRDICQNVEKGECNVAGS